MTRTSSLNGANAAVVLDITDCDARMSGCRMPKTNPTMKELLMTTIKDLDHIFEIYAAAVKDAGGVPEGSKLVLSHGSKTYGRAFRVHLTGDGTHPEKYNSAHYRPEIGDDFLGMTKNEADAVIRDRLRVIWDMKRIQNEQLARARQKAAAADWQREVARDDYSNGFHA